jgi:hypothetical protein
MTKPFEHVLGLIPKGVLAGLFVSLPHTLMTSIDGVVVHGHRCSAHIGSHGEDAVSCPRSPRDIAHRPVEQGSEVANLDLSDRRAHRLWRHIRHYSGRRL